MMVAPLLSTLDELLLVAAAEASAAEPAHEAVSGK